MLDEAELFEMSEQVLLEVLGRIREPDLHIVLPPLFDLPGADVPIALGAAVDLFAYDDGCVPTVLNGSWTDRDDRADAVRSLDGDRRAVLARTKDAAVGAVAAAAVRSAADGAAPVRTRYGELPVRDYLLRLILTRALFAHYVAAYLGSTACPLPEELARPLWELTAPEAQRWRSLGTFREPLPVPAQASWRDTFLLSAGHVPHPLGH